MLKFVFETRSGASFVGFGESRLRADIIRRLQFLNLANEPKAFAGERPDQTLLLATVPDRLAYRIDVTGEGGFGDDPPIPDCMQQIVLADNVFAVAQQVDQ